MFVAFVVLL